MHTKNPYRQTVRLKRCISYGNTLSKRPNFLKNCLSNREYQSEKI